MCSCAVKHCRKTIQSAKHKRDQNQYHEILHEKYISSITYILYRCTLNYTVSINTVIKIFFPRIILTSWTILTILYIQVFVSFRSLLCCCWLRLLWLLLSYVSTIPLLCSDCRYAATFQGAASNYSTNVYIYYKTCSRTYVFLFVERFRKWFSQHFRKRF